MITTLMGVSASVAGRFPRASGEDADAAGADEEADHDQDDGRRIAPRINDTTPAMTSTTARIHNKVATLNLRRYANRLVRLLFRQVPPSEG